MLAARVTALFFNSAELKKLMNKAVRQKLSQAGAYIRSDVQKSMKFTKSDKDERQKVEEDLQAGRLTPAEYHQRIYAAREKASAPGTPPNYHTRGFSLRNRVFFGIEPRDMNLVVGYLKEDSFVARLHEEGDANWEYRIRKPNWKLRVGGHAPIEIRNNELKFAKLRTNAQVKRATGIAKEYFKGYEKEGKTGRAKYEARPFLKPAMDKNRDRFVKELKDCL